MRIGYIILVMTQLLAHLANAEEGHYVKDPHLGQLATIPAGRFVMGAPVGDGDKFADERPQREISIDKPFEMAIHELTVDRFRIFVSATGHQVDSEKRRVGAWGYDAATRSLVQSPRFSWKSTGFQNEEGFPVVNVSWNDAVSYCRWLTDKSPQYVYRLPSEQEWEYACRAGATTRYAFGDRSRALVLRANIADEKLALTLPEKPHESWNDRHTFTAPAGTYKPNMFGLFNMYGNVAEWCDDHYDADQYLQPPGTRPVSGNERVFRGGSWLWLAKHSRSSRRHHMPSDSAWCNLGFRVVRESRNGN